MACTKKTYSTKKKAIKALSAIRTKRIKKSGQIVEQNLYKCLICQKYHLTSMTKQEQNRLLVTLRTKPCPVCNAIGIRCTPTGNRLKTALVDCGRCKGIGILFRKALVGNG